MRTGIGIAVVVAIGLIWSVAVMSQWVPVGQPGNEVGRASSPTRLIGTEAFTTGGSASGKRYSSAERQNAQNRMQARNGLRGDGNAAAKGRQLRASRPPGNL